MLGSEELSIDFSKEDLVPAIVRDHATGSILMLAYMNTESLARSRESGETWFWSRSRNELWNKGATSGNRQKIVSMQTDCDHDALLIDVSVEGPACHNGTYSCFPSEERVFSLSELASLLKGRKEAPAAGSYSSSLFQRGRNSILQKIGEEATEVILAATSESDERLVSEVADLAFHTLMLMIERGIDVSEVGKELERRRR